MQDFKGANVRFGNVGDLQSLEEEAFSSQVDVVVSCLASRTGGKVNVLRKKGMASSPSLALVISHSANNFEDIEGVRIASAGEIQMQSLS